MSNCNGNNHLRCAGRTLKCKRVSDLLQMSRSLQAREKSCVFFDSILLDRKNDIVFHESASD